MENLNKRVCVILIKDMEEGDTTIKKGDRVMRTTRSFALQLIASGYWAYCSKSKLKSFLNKDRKLSHNMQTLERMQEITGETYNERRVNGKVAVYVPTFKYKKPAMITDERKVMGYRATIEHNTRNGVQRFRKSDKSRFQSVEKSRKTMRFNPTAKAAKNHRQNNKKELVGTGMKMLVVAY